MFICSPCLDASMIKTMSISRSYGPCEMCNKVAECHDIHPRQIPTQEEKREAKLQ